MPHSYGRPRSAVLIIAAAGLLLGAAACAHPGTGSSPGSSSGPALNPATSAPPAPARAGAPCTASGLTFVSQLNQGAMGSAISTFTVRNHGTESCTLRGTPALLYVGGDGQPVLMPGNYTTAGNVITVRSGGRAQFDVKVVNGMGGYPPGSPQCGHPATFHHLSAQLPDGSTLALGANATISYQCDEADVAGWTAAG